MSDCLYCAGRDHDLITQRAHTRRDLTKLIALVQNARDVLEHMPTEIATATQFLDLALRDLGRAMPQAGV